MEFNFRLENLNKIIQLKEHLLLKIAMEQNSLDNLKTQLRMEKEYKSINMEKNMMENLSMMRDLEMENYCQPFQIPMKANLKIM